MQAELKDAARTYYDQGNNIVLVNGNKESLTKWAKWEGKRQTIEEFESLPWQVAEGFCVLCGRKMKNGMYFGVIDVDVKKTTQEVIDRGSELQKEFRITHTEETVSGGKHYIYYSRTPIRKVKNIRKILDFCGCEILGEKKLCVMAPSFGGKYRRLNDNPATGIESLNVLFETALEKIGYKTSRPLKNHARLERQREVRPCILRLIEKTHLSHLEKVAVTTEHKFSGMKQKEIEALFRKHNAWEGTDYNPEKTRYQINHIIDGGYKRFGKETLVDMGLCSENCPSQETCMINLTSFENEKGVFNPVLFAKHLLANFFFKTPRSSETLYVFNWEKGIYESTGEVFVKEQMVRDLDENTRQRYLADILFFIKGATYFEVTHNPLGKIAVENGILDVATRELTEYTPEMFVTTRLPITYDKDRKSPKILKFLEEVVNKEQMPVIQEMIGYCLYKDLPIHKALMLIGDGANGKSTLLGVIRKLLGQENISNASLQSICHNRFSVAQLNNKLANICADLSDRALKQTGMFKMLTGADVIQVEEKFKTPYSIKPHAKLIFLTNKIPETKDDTTAFFRRWLLIVCNNVFIGEKCNTNILNEITTPEELTGLLNFALDGLDRILKNGNFSTSDSIEELRKQYIRKSNSAKAFIEEKLYYENDPTAIIPTNDLYQKYIFFCQTNHLPTMQKRFLTLNIQEHLPQARQTMQRIGPKKKGTRVWQYVKFVTPVTPTLFKHQNNIKNNTNSVTPSKTSRDFFESKSPKNSVTEKESKSNGVSCLNEHAVTDVTKTVAQICPLCALELPRDGFDTTVWKGQVVHRVCYMKETQGGGGPL